MKRKRKKNFTYNEFEPKFKKRKKDVIKIINNKKKDFEKSQKYQTLQTLINKKEGIICESEDKIDELKEEIKNLEKEKKDNEYKFLKELLNEGVPLIFNKNPKIKETKILKFSIDLCIHATYISDKYSDPEELEEFEIKHFYIKNAKVVDILFPQLKKDEKCYINIQKHLVFRDFKKLFLFEFDISDYISEYLVNGYHKYGKILYYIEECIINNLYLVVKK